MCSETPERDAKPGLRLATINCANRAVPDWQGCCGRILAVLTGC